LIFQYGCRKLTVHVQQIPKRTARKVFDLFVLLLYKAICIKQYPMTLISTKVKVAVKFNLSTKGKKDQ